MPYGEAPTAIFCRAGRTQPQVELPSDRAMTSVKVAQKFLYREIFAIFDISPV
jgi:hypothetical protein